MNRLEIKKSSTIKQRDDTLHRRRKNTEYGLEELKDFRKRLWVSKDSLLNLVNNREIDPIIRLEIIRDELTNTNLGGYI